jgi:hypothetical protein
VHSTSKELTEEVVEQAFQQLAAGPETVLEVEQDLFGDNLLQPDDGQLMDDLFGKGHVS